MKWERGRPLACPLSRCLFTKLLVSLKFWNISRLLESQVDQSGNQAPLRNLAQEFRSRDGEEAEKENRPQQAQVEEKGLEKVVAQLAAMNSKLNTLTQTVLLVEKRIGLVEEQVRLLSRK